MHAEEAGRTAGDLPRAVTEWTEVLGRDRVAAPQEPAGHCDGGTIASPRRIPAVIRPATLDEVVAVVNIARRHRVPLYPVSGGRNWGYGDANPVTHGCVVVDLSGMNRVLEVDPALGLATVEPGVTQGALRRYLDEHALPFMVPTHGGGPTCSLLGNALERGYGITPHTDHFGAVTALEAVLPNGEVYRTPLSELGGGEVDRAFKWGVGPYVDGLFSQGNFGIVTRMTLALAPRPQRIEAFFFTVKADSDLEEIVARTRDLLRQIGAVVGSLNLMNARRVLSMTIPYPRERAVSGILAEGTVGELSRRHGVTSWTGVGALYGSDEVVRAARAVTRRMLRPAVGRLVFMTPERLEALGPWLSMIPGRWGQGVNRRLDMLQSTLRVMAGSPSEVALPLAYWKSHTRSEPGQPLDPGRDGCGLIWYSPLVPMKPQSARAYVEMVHEVCRAHAMEPLITLTTLSDRCYDSTVPLLFDRSDPEETQRAQACYRALFRAGCTHGFIPYRANIDSMSLFLRPESSFWRLTRGLKRAVDPDDIIAPGRYSIDL